MKITAYRQLCRQLQEAPTQACQSYKRLTTVYDCVRRYYRLLHNPYLPLHHRNRMIYIHVPKTGGNSVTKIVFNEKSPRAGSHRAAWEYLDYSPEWFKQYFIFASVRHPLIRLHSAFYFLKAGGANDKDKRWAKRHLAHYDSFQAFMRGLRNLQYRQEIMRGLHFIPQSYFLCDWTGKQIVHNFVQTENLDRDLKGMCERFSIPFIPRHDNTTPHRLIRTGDFDEDAVLTSYDMYRRDYDLLGYGRYPD